ncbi:uncharacterized protein LOC131435102 isoform X2 [Malaya genurostris]|nr:uncharacterized protein LOC131435102 isoform X2 [Malaya genurostris]
MADEQKPGPSQASASEKNPTGQQPNQPQGKGRKRKLSTRQGVANKREPTEETLDAERLRCMVEPVLETLRSMETRNEGDTMNALIETLQPSQVEIEMALNKVKMDLSNVLPFPNNNFMIYDFGSIRSGLAFRDSDLDFYVHYEKNNENKMDQKKLIHVIGGRMSRDPNFYNLTKILGAKVPLLRAIHGPTNLTCDINFCNARGCYNSKFIYAVTRFDHRIHKLAVIVKFWAKCAFLLTNHRQMNTYCIIMMLIFYLQTKKLPLLPSVQDLQMGIPRVNYGPWNLGYPRDINFMSMNKESVRSLLINFFKYYANFEYEKNLISPYVGRLCTVLEMKQSKVRELQPYYRAVEHQDYPPFNFGTMISIQDPFELNLNIGGVCNSAAHFEQFKLSFKTAYEVCSSMNSEPFNKLLEGLFTNVKRYQKPGRAVSTVGNNGTVKKENGQIDNWKICRLLPIEYELFIVRQILLAKLTDKDGVITERQIKDMWAECTLDFIEDILQKIYLCKLEPLPEAFPITVPSSIEKKDIRTFQLTCERQVIFKRPRLQFSNEEELNNEIAVSKARWQLNKPLAFSTRLDMFKTQDAIEFHITEEQRKNGAIRVFVETCFLTQVRKCIGGYFKLMLAKTEEKSRTQAV